MAAAKELLTGLRVIDCSLWQPGQYAAQLLADLGAEVIKIEPPGGDRMRFLPDRFFSFNGYKHSVVADLKTAAGRDRVLALAREAEVFIEGFKPGVADRLGVGYEQLHAVNRALVYCSISGFGQSGPLVNHSGHDHNYQAYAGAITLIDGKPALTKALIGDQGSGMTAAFAICAALLCARRTGEGEHIDVSIADIIASWVAPAVAVDPTRASPATHGMAGIGTFATADGGAVVLGVFSEDRLWTALCNGLGLRDIAPILTPEEMLDLPHFTARGLIGTAPDGSRALAHPVRYRQHPARTPGLPPALDSHGERGFANAPDHAGKGG